MIEIQNHLDDINKIINNIINLKYDLNSLLNDMNLNISNKESFTKEIIFLIVNRVIDEKNLDIDSLLSKLEYKINSNIGS